MASNLVRGTLESVAFHTGVPEPLDYAYRLLRKAVGQGAQVTVVAPAAQLQALEAQLWAAEPSSFFSHVTVANQAGAEDGAALPEPVRWAAIWLAPEDQARSWARPVLLNLGITIPACIAGCVRLIEVVSTDEIQRQQAKQRWRTYQSWGLQPLHHPYLAT